MKLLCSLLALGSLAIVAPNLYADPTLVVNAGVVGGTLLQTDVAGVYTWTYTDDTTGASIIPTYAYTDNNVFTAVLAEVGGAEVLNVNDLCLNAAVGIAATPCSLGFTFTDASLGTPFLEANGAVLGILGVDINADAVGLDVGGASIGGGSAQIGFSNPAPTPEPGTLTLMGTGLLGIAGVVRRRFTA